MNLKDWLAMSRDEQRAYWDSLSQEEQEEQKRAVAGYAGHSFAFYPKDRTSPAGPDKICCPPGMTDVRNWLSAQIPEEKMAAKDYREQAAILDSLGIEDLPAALNKMAAEEYSHYLSNIAMVSILDQMCDCEQE